MHCSLQDLRTAATIPVESVEKSPKSNMSLQSGFGALASAAKDVMTEGPAGPQKLDEMVYHSRSMGRGE